MYAANKIKSKYSKPRILFMGEDIALSHVVRPLVLADAIRNDYDVIFATGERYAHLIQERNIAYKQTWTVPSDLFISRIAKGEDAWSVEDFSREVEEDLALIKEISPDLIIGDLRYSLAISSPLSQIPYISLTNTYWTPHYNLTPPPPELPFVKILGVKISSLLMPLLLPMVLKQLAIPFNKVRENYNLTTVKDYRDISVCDAFRVCYLDIPSLAPTKNFPPSHSYLGPIQWTPNVPLPTWWDNLPQDKPIVYLTMGSSGKVSFIKEIIDELSQMDFAIMLATSGRFQQNSFPDNVFAAEYLPGIEACKKSELIICNGGTGSIYQAILSGTIILGIPTNGDQYWAMGAVEQLGAGLLLRSSHVNRQRIRLAVTKLINNPSFREKCEKFRKELKNYDAIEKFKNLIKSIWQE